MEVIKQIMNSDIGILIAFILEIVAILQIFLPKRIKEVFANAINQNNFKSWLILLMLLIIFVLAPSFLIFKSFDWSGWRFWVTQVLSWYALFSFIGAIYFIFWAKRTLKNLDK